MTLLARVVPFRVDLVFRAWVDPDLVSRWGGPDGYDVPRELITIEPRVGGRYDYCMVQDGERYWLRNEITELVTPTLLVFVSDPMPEFGVPEPVTTRVELEQAGPNQTRLTIHRPYPPERLETARAGWHSAIDKLEATL